MEKLVLKAQQGEEDAKIKILENLKALIISSILKYHRSEDMEDLIQEGYEIVLESINNYDINKGAYFLGFVQMNLRHFYLNKDKKPKSLSLNVHIYESKELIDTIVSDELDTLDRIIKSQGNLKLYEAYDTLAPRQKEIISLYYIQSYSMVQISKHLNLSYRSVINIKIQAIAKLKRYFKIR